MRPIHPHANLPSEESAVTKRTRPARIEPQKPTVRKSSLAPHPSALALARTAGSPCPPAFGAVCASARTLAERANRNTPELEIVATSSKIRALQILIATLSAFLPRLSLSDCRSRITTHKSQLTSLEIDSQNHLEQHLTLSKSIECNFATVRLMGAHVPIPGDAERRKPPAGPILGLRWSPSDSRNRR